MVFSGGCSCGAVRYTLRTEPVRAFQCQCRDCQMDSGGGHSSVLVFSRATFEISGEVREIARTCRAVVWLNPEDPARWGTGDSAIKQYAREVKLLVPSRNLRELQVALTAIA